MAPQIAVGLIATTLLVFVLFVWSILHYVPQVLYGDDQTDDSPIDPGRPS